MDLHGRRGMARGAVVLIVSDGWERDDPSMLGGQMLQLRRHAHRIVWANPRVAAPGFAPLVGGMAAALRTSTRSSAATPPRHSPRLSARWG